MLLQESENDNVAPAATTAAAAAAAAAAPAAVARASMFDLDDGGDVDLGEWRCFAAV